MGLFKKNKKPYCFGISSKLSVECHNCNEKELCLDHINSRTSGTFYIPTNKPYPKHIIETKKPPKAVWTLEKAIEDYNKNNPRCESCEFSTTEYEEVLQCMELGYIQCKVKSDKTVNSNAEKCKYYTIKLGD